MDDRVVGNAKWILAMRIMLNSLSLMIELLPQDIILEGKRKGQKT